MKSSIKWAFPAKFRSGCYGWRGSQKAAQNLKAAVREIRKAAKTEPVQAGEGAIKLLGRIWPAFQHIDTSSGALGTAVNHALEDDLVPLLIDLDADIGVRRKWMEKLQEAVDEDGVDYLWPVRERWGEICVFPELAGEWADHTREFVRQVYVHNRLEGRYGYTGTDVVLFSCLLATGRHDEIIQFLELDLHPHWSTRKFAAMSLVRQGRSNEALGYAEGLHSSACGGTGNDDWQIEQFCEQLLLDAGRLQDAYKGYGLQLREGTTYLNQFRAITKKYSQMEPRRILEDLMRLSGNPSQWFSAARQTGHLDLALECALKGRVDPCTLIRAARDYADKDPEFSLRVSFRALAQMIYGEFYEITTVDLMNGYDLVIKAARHFDQLEKAITQIRRWMEETKHLLPVFRETLNRRLEREIQDMRGNAPEAHV
ncbi:MAG: hypothetical protein HQL31_05485 [Planctomycetes bacterium]|nr:hypothetical protein [Planctomycetota bacterium]